MYGRVQDVSGLPSPKINVRAGSGQKLRDLYHPVKPALIEANFYLTFKSFPLFLRWAGLAELENIGAHD